MKSPASISVCVLFGIFVLCATSTTGFAQVVGNCGPGKSEVYLEGGNARALLTNNGDLFGGANYEVPRGSGINTHYGMSLIVGGLVNGTLRLAESRSSLQGFWPGPLDGSGNPPPNCVIYDKIYKVRASEVSEFLDGAPPSESIASWPYHLGAPVVDRDGVRDNYNLTGGDRPLNLGYDSAWWLMNDLGNNQRYTDSLAPGMEIQVFASTLNAADFQFYSATTFFEYLFIYKGSEPVEDLHVGFYHDIDLGEWLDDFTGSDSLLSLAFNYNAKDIDDQYGQNPPALGVVLLDLDESDATNTRISSYLPYRKTFAGAAGSAQEWYNHLRCRDKLGRYLGEGHLFMAFQADDPPFTCFPWSGDPSTGEGISMEFPTVGFPSYLADGYDWRFVVGTGPHTLMPGDSLLVPMAIIWTRGSDRLDSVRQLKGLAKGVRGAYLLAKHGHPYPWDPNREDPLIPGIFPAVAGDLSPQIGSVFPNPATTNISVKYWIPAEQMVKIRLVDILGRSVRSRSIFADKGENQDSLQFAEIPPGIYLLEVTGLHGSASRKNSVVR